MTPSTNDIFAEAALGIARRICRDAIWDAGRCNWITSCMDDSGAYPKTYFRSLDPEFYGGTSGIAYFLASAYSLDKSPIIRATAYGAIRQAISQATKMPRQTGLGFYTGILGIACSMIHTGTQLEDNGLIRDGISRITELMATPADQFNLDVIEGAAGAIPALLNLYGKYGIEEFITGAIDIGRHLIAIRQQEPVGSSWKTTAFATHNLTGFGHGAAGISHALFELYGFTGQEEFGRVAAEGIAYENYYFDEQAQNWPDFRTFNGKLPVEAEKNVFSCAWCHGAAGIGLARLRAFEITGNEVYREDARKAIATVLRTFNLDHTRNFSLCHGLFGNAELLLEGSRVLGDEDWKDEAGKMAMLAIRQYLDEAIPLPNGVSNNFDNPEFMTGTSGMGYFFLELSDPRRFPSVLTGFGGALKLTSPSSPPETPSR